MKKVCCFSTHDFEKEYLQKYSEQCKIEITYIYKKLDIHTVALAKGFDAILCWANDNLNSEVLEALSNDNCKMISLRCAGFSNMDIQTAKSLNFTVSRVSSYSPESIAEHACTLYLTLNRKIITAHKRVKDFNFSLEGLQGSVVYGKTVGIIGFGQIGQAFARIMSGFGCNILIFDEFQKGNHKDSYNFSSLEDLLTKSDIISLHCPLTPETHHILDEQKMSLIKKSAYIINTGRGGLIDSRALINSLKLKSLAGVGLDVYEYEENIFFNDLSENGIVDEDLMVLMSFPNVLVTSHQAFFTKEALNNIAKISVENISSYFKNEAIDPSNILLREN